jgi:hypothetical protein
MKYGDMLGIDRRNDKSEHPRHARLISDVVWLPEVCMKI